MGAGGFLTLPPNSPPVSLLGLPPVLAECVPLSEAVQICELSKEEDFENALEAAAN
jgi:hypothetical protein